MCGFIPNNQNLRNADAVIRIANHLREREFSKGNDIGEIENQILEILDTRIIIRVRYSNRYILTLIDDDVDDFAHNYKTIKEVIDNATLIEVDE